MPRWELVVATLAPFHQGTHKASHTNEGPLGGGGKAQKGFRYQGVGLTPNVTHFFGDIGHMLGLDLGFRLKPF